MQERLYVTKEIADVAAIAKEEGFNITGAEILRAQANRMLILSAQDLEDVAAGKKTKMGGQWGRADKGYLDSAGFWVLEFIQWGCTHLVPEQQLAAFLTQIKESPTIKRPIIHPKVNIN